MIKWHPIPERSPGQLRDKLIVAWIAFKADESERVRGKAESQLSILYLELLMRYSSSTASESARKRLTRPLTPTKGGWLTLTTPARGRHGNFYKPGKLAESDLEGWLKVGKLLYGPRGLLEPYRCRPIFSGSGLGPYGCLVLAVVDRFGPIEAIELNRMLKSYMAVPSVRRHLGHAKSYGLIREKSGEFFTTADLREQVRDLENDLGAEARCFEIDSTRDRKWIAFQTEILGRPDIELVKATLRKLDCFYCGRTPRPTGGQVERFPPKQWGGSYERSLLLPICRKCNTRHGGRLSRSAKEDPPTIEEPIQVLIEGSAGGAIDHFAKLMAMNSIEYAVAMNEGRVRDAREAALRNFPVWAAIKGLGAGVKFVDPRTGEKLSNEPTSEHLTFLDFLESMQGIPGLLDPLLDREGDGRTKRRR